MKLFAQLKQFTLLLLLLYFPLHSQAQGLSIAVAGANTGSTMAVSSTSVVNESCAGASDGQITIVIAGGTPNYTYSWYDDAFLTSSARAGLAAGTYTVEVTDAAGCKKVQSLTLTAPLPLIVSATASDTLVCSGTQVGLSANAAGGTAPYTYSWDNGAGSSLNANVTPLITTIYTVYVTDAHACVATNSVTVNVTAVPNTGLAAIPLQECTMSATTINLAALLTGEDAGGTWTLQSPLAGVTGFNASTGEFTPLGNSAATYLFTYSITAASCPIASSSVSVVLDNMNCPIRPTLGDFASNVNCQTFSGSSWIDVFDNNGNLVFSINPNGNNLGATCWGIRVENNALPRSIVSNFSVPTDSVFYVDRNIYINPTNQPDSTMPVFIRMYVLDAEIQRFTSALGISNSQIGVTRFSGSSMSAVDLDPTNDYTTQPSQAAYLTQNTFSFGTDWRFDFQTNHFSEFNPGYSGIASPGVFPVNLVSFRGEQKGNYHYLDWTTSYELNTDGFEIEHSQDGVGFENIGKQAALGVVGGGHSYTFINETPNLGNNYYRLKLKDKNGTSDYSNIVVLSYSPELSVFVFPNPVKDRLTFDIQGISHQKQMVRIEIFNALGQFVEVKEIEISGNVKEEINVESLANGIYHYMVTIGGQVLKGKIVKE
jgi:hypothetical protein